MTITQFDGDYAFLSNFYPSPVGQFPTAENAFQAAKTTDPEQRQRFVSITPAAAKRLGRKVTLRPGWNEMRIDVMETVLRHKFQDPELWAKLVATRDHELVEGNGWHDRFWGQCPVGNGHNHLGKLLMKIRDEG